MNKQRMNLIVQHSGVISKEWQGSFCLEMEMSDTLVKLSNEVCCDRVGSSSAVLHDMTGGGSL